VNVYPYGGKGNGKSCEDFFRIRLGHVTQANSPFERGRQSLPGDIRFKEGMG